MIRKLKYGALALSILIFLASLTQPAFFTSAEEPDGWANSLGLLLMGWSGALYGGAGITWFANPLLILSWIIVFKYSKTSMWLSLFAALLSLSFLAFKRIITDEAGNYSTITNREGGYWLWLASICFFAVSTVIIYFTERNQSKSMKF